MNGPRIPPAELNYEGIGSTEHGPPPAEVECLITHAYLGHGIAAYRRAVQGLLTWQLQKRAGLRVRAESDVVVPGARVVSGFGVGPFRIDAPCEVVWVRRPVAGAGRSRAGSATARFLATRSAARSPSRSPRWAGQVLIEIRAFGVPSNWFYAAGGALTRRARSLVTSRYIRSAQELAAEASNVG